MGTFRDFFYRECHIPGLEAEGVKYGVPIKELEYTIYAELEDLEALRLAYAIEQHEQWRIPFYKDDRVKARIRCTDERDWHLTLKESSDEYAGVDETTMIITKEVYDTLKKVACDGYNKTRYNFR